MRKCPACRTTLRKFKEQGGIVDVCDLCNGIWLDRGELEQLVDSSLLNKRLPIVASKETVGCPDCVGKELVAIKSNVRAISGCDNCGGVFVHGSKRHGNDSSNDSPSQQSTENFSVFNMAELAVLLADVISAFGSH
jgi:Zn-finger nucleic acid-binding protein